METCRRSRRCSPRRCCLSDPSRCSPSSDCRDLARRFPADRWGGGGLDLDLHPGERRYGGRGKGRWGGRESLGGRRTWIGGGGTSTVGEGNGFSEGPGAVEGGGGIRGTPRRKW